MRPVVSLKSSKSQLVQTLQQVFLSLQSDISQPTVSTDDQMRPPDIPLLTRGEGGEACQQEMLRHCSHDDPRKATPVYMLAGY